MYSLLDDATINGLQRAVEKWDPGQGWIVRYDEVARLWSARTPGGDTLPPLPSIEEAAVYWCRLFQAKHSIPMLPLPSGIR